METEPTKLPYSSGDGVWVKATYRGQSANGLYAMVTLKSSQFPGEPTPVSVDRSDVSDAFDSAKAQGDLLDALYSARNLLDSLRCRKAIETVAEAVRRGEVTIHSEGSLSPRIVELIASGESLNLEGVSKEFLHEGWLNNLRDAFLKQASECTRYDRLRRTIMENDRAVVSKGEQICPGCGQPIRDGTERKEHRRLCDDQEGYEL